MDLITLKVIKILILGTYKKMIFSKGMEVKNKILAICGHQISAIQKPFQLKNDMGIDLGLFYSNFEELVLLVIISWRYDHLKIVKIDFSEFWEFLGLWPTQLFLTLKDFSDGLKRSKLP